MKDNYNFFLLFDIHKNDFVNRDENNKLEVEVVYKTDIITLKKLLQYDKNPHIYDDYLRLLYNDYYWNNILMVPINNIKEIITGTYWNDKGTFMFSVNSVGIMDVREFNIPWDLTTGAYLGSKIKKEDIDNNFILNFTKMIEL